MATVEWSPSKSAGADISWSVEAKDAVSILETVVPFTEEPSARLILSSTRFAGVAKGDSAYTA